MQKFTKILFIALFIFNTVTAQSKNILENARKNVQFILAENPSFPDDLQKIKTNIDEEQKSLIERQQELAEMQNLREITEKFIKFLNNANINQEEKNKFIEDFLNTCPQCFHIFIQIHQLNIQLKQQAIQQQMEQKKEKESKKNNFGNWAKRTFRAQEEQEQQRLEKISQAYKKIQSKFHQK